MRSRYIVRIAGWPSLPLTCQKSCGIGSSSSRSSGKLQFDVNRNGRPRERTVSRAKSIAGMICTAARSAASTPHAITANATERHSRVLMIRYSAYAPISAHVCITIVGSPMISCTPATAAAAKRRRTENASKSRFTSRSTSGIHETAKRIGSLADSERYGPLKTNAAAPIADGSGFTRKLRIRKNAPIAATRKCRMMWSWNAQA